MDKSPKKIRDFSEAEWENTPKSVQKSFERLEEENKSLKTCLEKLQARLNKNSQNSSSPPSQDNPYSKAEKNKSKPKGKPGGKKGHKGHGPKLKNPTKVIPLMPDPCSCGGGVDSPTEPYYTHQHIELPEIKMEVIHFVLHKGRCNKCRRILKAKTPKEYRTGFGPRFSAMIAEISGTYGDSRRTVQQFCASVLGVDLSLGVIQKIIDRTSKAIKPHYEAIKEQVRKHRINHIDETSWYENGILMWLWTMVNCSLAFFMIHPHRSKEAFKALIDTWEGILVSDGLALYRKWVNLRQTCLGHLIRAAQGLSESTNPQIQKFGKSALGELKLLCHMAHAPPTKGQWRAFYARLCKLIFNNIDHKDDRGRFARRLLREMESLWVFLEVKGVEPTNNRAERTIRFGVLWRKRSQGTCSDKGNRWVERILTVKESCRLQGKSSFQVLCDALENYFKEQSPDLNWIYTVK